MRKLLTLPIITLLCTGCTISSPFTTAENYLRNLSNKEFSSIYQYTTVFSQDGNHQFLNESQQKQFLQEFNEWCGSIRVYEVIKALPFAEEDLTAYKVMEGNWLVYTIDCENSPKQQLGLAITKLNQEYVVVWTPEIRRPFW
ncbi:hypothetical protein C4579_01630 [Candidatus Microgenomates bacterium]|nr:MAG: hypothetical protein C4579_01630 [Candidatus Microgenomates bacterium]